jgi:hypothetical protein
MCLTEVFVDRYPDGGEVEFSETRLCQYGHSGRPCETHSVVENTPRKIQYGEPTSEYILTQMTPPRSSTSSQRSSLVEFRDESPQPKRTRRSGGILTSALFGDPRYRRRSGDKVIVVDGPPSPRSPRTTPPPPPRSRLPGYHLTLPPSRTPPAFIYDTAPRGRRPVVVDNHRHPLRGSSVEVVISNRQSGRRARSRSPSPTFAQLRRLEEEEERERRRRRDEREAELAAEVRDARERRRREERRAKHDAEIDARPPVPPPRPAVPNPPQRRRPFTPVVEQSDRLNDIIGDIHLSSRGERVIAEAVADRKRKENIEEKEKMVQAGIDAEETEARRQRLRRRFTISGSPVNRRHRIMYDDRTYRYEQLP